MKSLIFNLPTGQAGTNWHKSLFIIFLFLCFFVLPSPAQAEGEISVNLRIETNAGNVLNKIVSVPYACEVMDSALATSTHDGHKAICALQTAQEQGLLTYQVTDWGWGFSLDKINETANATDWSQTWIIRINNATAQTGIDGLALNAGDNLLITYGPWPMEPLQSVLSTTTLVVNDKLDLQVRVWDDNANSFINFATNSIFWIGDNSYESSSGTLLWTAGSEGEKQVWVEAEGKTRSEIQIINIMPSPQETTVNLNLRQQNNLIFSGQVTLPTSTIIIDNTGTEHFTSSTNVLTALLTVDAASDNFAVTDLQYYENWQSFYLNCISITMPTSTSLCGNWNYVVDGNYPAVGMNKYHLSGNENIYIYFNNPWQITASTSTFPLGTTTTFYTWRYNYDNLDAEWAADANDSIDISTTTIASNDQGYVDYKFSATGTFYAKISSPDWSKWSNPITLTVFDAATSTATSTDNNTNDNSNNNGNNNPPENNNQAIAQSEINSAAQKILNYLKSQQSADGKIIDGTITDWAIMSFSANGQYADEIKKEGGQSLLDYEKNYNLDDPSDMNKCASYPRHVLALLASGVSKNDNAIIGLKNKIKNTCYKNNSYGENGINDDVFGLLALLAVDESASEPIVSDIIAAIKSDQTADGAFTWAGWAGVDMTGAALNALKYAESKGAILEQNIYSKAKQYLKTQQLADGGWGYSTSDALTTSWALMGINALNETQENWFNASGKNPWHPLINQLKIDGYYESSWAPGTVDWFAVKHAVPALLGKSWPIIMPVKIAKFETGNNVTYTGSSGTCIEQTQTTTSTDAINRVSTTTAEIATTTLIVKTLTSTPTANEITATPITTSINHHITESQPATTPITITSQNNNATTIPETTATPTVYYQTLSTAATSTQPINTAKTVFNISLTAASGLGLFLAWRLLQTMI